MKGLLKPSEKLTDRLPDRAGIRQLVGEGKLLPLNKTLKEKFLKSDLWFSHIRAIILSMRKKVS